MGQLVQLQTELPNELCALVYRDSVPVQRVCVRFGLSITRPEDPHLGVSARPPPCFSIA